MLIYSAALFQFDRTLLEAADLDGASTWQKIRSLLLPHVKPVTASMVLVGVIVSFQQFALIYEMTSGGPANSTQVLSTYIFQLSFVELQFNYASAVAVVFLGTAIVVEGVLLVGANW